MPEKNIINAQRYSNSPGRHTRRRFRSMAGLVSIEFAVLAVPLLGLIFGIIEISVNFFLEAAFQTAINDAARDILTGSAYSANYATAQNFIDGALCGSPRRLPTLMDCSKVYVDVSSATGFSAASIAYPVSNSRLDVSQWSYNPINSGKIAVVRAVYTIPALTTGLLGTVNTITSVSTSNGQSMSYTIPQRVLWATAVFKAEPF